MAPTRQTRSAQNGHSTGHMGHCARAFMPVDFMLGGSARLVSGERWEAAQNCPCQCVQHVTALRGCDAVHAHKVVQGQSWRAVSTLPHCAGALFERNAAVCQELTGVHGPVLDVDRAASAIQATHAALQAQSLHILAVCKANDARDAPSSAVVQAAPVVVATCGALLNSDEPSSHGRGNGQPSCAT